MNSHDGSPGSNADDIEECLATLVERIDHLENQIGLSTTAPDGSRVSFAQLLEFGLTRRQAIAALGFVAAGATIAGAITRSVEIGTIDDENGNSDATENRLDVASVRTDRADIESLTVTDDGEISRFEAIDASVIPRYSDDEEMLDLTDKAGSLGMVETNGGKSKLKWRVEDA